MSDARPSPVERMTSRPWLSATVIAAALFVTFLLATTLPLLAILLGYFLATVVVVRLAIGLVGRHTHGRRGPSS